MRIDCRFGLFSSFSGAQELERFVRYSQADGEIHWGMVHGDEVYQLAGHLMRRWSILARNLCVMN